MSHEICTLRPMYSLHSSFMEQFSNFKLRWTIIMGKGKLTWPFSAHFRSPPAGSNHWSLAGSRNLLTFSGKWLRWFTRTRQTTSLWISISSFIISVCDLMLIYITICLCKSQTVKLLKIYRYLYAFWKINLAF
jgi:hypothetical protein